MTGKVGGLQSQADGTEKENYFFIQPQIVDINVLERMLTEDEKTVLGILQASDSAMNISEIRKVFVLLLWYSYCGDDKRSLQRAPGGKLPEDIWNEQNKLISSVRLMVLFPHAKNIMSQKEREFLSGIGLPKQLPKNTNDLYFKTVEMHIKRLGVIIPGFNIIKHILDNLIKLKIVVKREIDGKKEKEVFFINPFFLTEGREKQFGKMTFVKTVTESWQKTVTERVDVTKL